MILIVSSSDVSEVVSMLKAAGEPNVYELGVVVHRGANKGNAVKINNMDAAW